MDAEENPEFWRLIYDELNDKQVYLTDKQLEIVKRIKNRTIIDDTIRTGDYSYELPIDSTPFSVE